MKTVLPTPSMQRLVDSVSTGALGLDLVTTSTVMWLVLLWAPVLQLVPF